MVDIQRAYFNGHRGWMSATTGRVRFGNTIYSNIFEAIRHLSQK
jgi:hypothetical protein